MDNRAIGLIDSGVGGFTVLKQMQRFFKQENFVYFGDSENMPYGERPNNEIIDLVQKGIGFLEEKNVKAIVLACNTASSLIEDLRSRAPLFSIIEAGCQAVLEHQSGGPVGLIATRATVGNKAYEREMPKYSKDVYFVSYGTPTLAQVINNQRDEILLLKKNIRLAIDPILERYPIKNLLLGCTHYPIVSTTIREMYPELWLIDPAKKEIDLVLAKLQAQDQLGKGANKTTEIYITGSDLELKRSRDLLKELSIDYNVLESMHLG